MPLLLDEREQYLTSCPHLLSKGDTDQMQGKLIYDYITGSATRKNAANIPAFWQRLCGIISYVNGHHKPFLPESIPDDSLLRAIAQAVYEHHLLPTVGAAYTLIVGVSGGADSVGLLHALHSLVPAWGLVLHVAHLDHSLRPDSAQDADFVATLAQRWNLVFHTRQLAANALASHPGGVEDAARQARYQFLCQVACQVTPTGQPPTIALAHHADDQAETVLMNLIRGSGLAGLAGMRWVSEISPDTRLNNEQNARKVRVIRPLLGVQRSEIRAYLLRHQLSWRDDPTNQNRELLRNRLRHDVIPLLTQINPQLTQALARTADIIAAEAARAEAQNQQAWHAVVLDGAAQEGPNNQATVRFVFDLSALQALDVATQRGVLRLALAALGADLRDSGFDTLERLRHGLTAEAHAGGPYPLIASLVWTVLDADATHAARLCLHQADELPIPPDQPYLDQPWRLANRWQRVPTQGVITLRDNWTLHSSEYTIDQLPADWSERGQPWRAFLDAASVGNLVLTTPRAGLRFAPLGMEGHGKSLGDYFTDHKVATALRSGWPLLIDSATDEVVWVCGLQLAHSVRITPTTQRVRHVWWTQPGGTL